MGPDFGPKVRTESEIRTFQKNGLSSIPILNGWTNGEAHLKKAVR